MKILYIRSWNERESHSILDQGLTFKQHIHNTCRNFRAAKSKFYPLIARKSKLSIKNKIFIYTSYLRPILTCSCVMCSYVANTHFKLLIKSKNSTVLQAFDMLQYIQNFHNYKSVELPRLNDFMQQLNLNFHLVLESIENNAFITVTEYEPTHSCLRLKTLP